MITTLKHGVFRFSGAAITAKTYAKFQEKYQANLQNFQKKASEAERFSQTIKKSTQRTYTHPIDNSHRKITLNAMKTHELAQEFFGAEQVSPHYENFGMARREALIFWAGYFIMKFISQTPDIHYYADASVAAWCMIWGYLYFWTEGKKSYAMPILGRFYKKIATMEMSNLYYYHAENSETRTRELMRIAKSQI